MVLVHGFSQTNAIWRETRIYDDLVRDHRVIAVDLRGHGDSRKPHQPSAYGPNLHRDLVELLDRLGIDRAHFVGFSLGASVVGDLVVSRPERVQTATMGSGFFTRWDEREEEFASLIEKQKPALAALVRGARFSEVSAEQIAAVDTPVLIVFGSVELDDMTDSQRQRLRRLPRSIQVLTVEGADHDSQNAAILSPEFSQAVRALIAANPTR